MALTFLLLLGLIWFWTIQVRTHSIRKAHENIDKTLKAEEVVLAQFDLSRQVGLSDILCFTVLQSSFD